MRKHVVGTIVLLIAGLLSTASGEAAEYALIVGGGNSPTRNPASIERQVVRAIEILKQRDVAQIDVLFADGNNGEPDVIERQQESTDIKSAKVLPATDYLRRLLGRDFGLKLISRDHRVSNVRGAATLANLEAWFHDQGSQLRASDSLLIYFATHGTFSDDDVTLADEKTQHSPGGSELILWDHKRLSVHKLASLIAQIPPGVRVQLLITACYSGGFAELGWPARLDQSNQRQATSQGIVAGFFATSSDRPAVGCTSAADSPVVGDYATCFWSALAGKWPNGNALSGIDLDRDRVVSLSEAHAFALMADPNLDTPLMTSDYALRQISRFGRADEVRLLSFDPYYSELYNAAPPKERVLLEQLSDRVKLREKRRLSKARAELRKLDFDLRTLATEREELVPKEKKLRAEILVTLTKAFPELSASQNQSELMSLKLMEFVKQKQQEIVKSITGAPSWTELLKYQDRLTKIDAERMLLEKLWARYQRFIQTAESVILAHNLPLVVEDKAVLERFKALKTVENAPLAEAK